MIKDQRIGLVVFFLLKKNIAVDMTENLLQKHLHNKSMTKGQVVHRVADSTN